MEPSVYRAQHFEVGRPNAVLLSNATKYLTVITNTSTEKASAVFNREG